MRAAKALVVPVGVQRVERRQAACHARGQRLRPVLAVVLGRPPGRRRRGEGGLRAQRERTSVGVGSAESRQADGAVGRETRRPRARLRRRSHEHWYFMLVCNMSFSGLHVHVKVKLVLFDEQRMSSL